MIRHNAANAYSTGYEMWLVKMADVVSHLHQIIRACIMLRDLADARPAASLAWANKMLSQAALAFGSCGCVFSEIESGAKGG